MAHMSIEGPTFLQIDKEIQDLVQRMATASIDGTGKERLAEDKASWKLARLHCPFTWKPIYDGNENVSVMNKTEEKLATIDDEGEEFTAWTTFVLNLILCYENTQMGAIENAFKNQQVCNQIVEQAIASGITVPLMGAGLKHIIDACQVFLLIKSKLYDEAIENLSNITDIEAMDYKEQASIWGIRGALFLEYGFEGMKESVIFIEKALKLDSECGEWHFLLGKALSRYRRIEYKRGIPGKREIESLEKAIQLSKKTLYMVLLAQTYMDTAKQISWQNRIYTRKSQNYPGHIDWKSQCEEMNRKAFDMYRKAYENHEENSYILARCAYGFLKLPHPWGSMNFAGECIYKGLEKNCSNSFLNHTAGMYFFKRNEYDRAKYHFAHAAENGSFGACLQLLSIKKRENTSYNPVPDLERYVNLFKEKPWREQLFGILGAFYYFERNDFNTALKYWQELMDSDMNSVFLESLEIPWPSKHYLCNISKIIVGEIITQVETCSEEKKIIYGKVLVKFKKYYPQLVRSIQNMRKKRLEYKNY